jgi:hypothetical protein
MYRSILLLICLAVSCLAPGGCTIVGVKVEGENKDDDYSFKELDDDRDEDGAVAGGKTSVEFWAKDYGGQATIDVVGVKGVQSVVLKTLTVPLDKDGDKVADSWELKQVENWNAQYGVQEEVKTAFFAADSDKELKDPDGTGADRPLTEHKTAGDGITALDEYRGFVLDGGGFDGAGQGAHQGGHLRLSAARKELLLEVDREQQLADAPAGGVKPFLDGASRVWSQATRGAGVYVYYLLDNENLPAPDFTGDANAQRTKQGDYLQASREHANRVVDEGLNKFFNHVVVISTVPATLAQDVKSAWGWHEDFTTLRKRGIYLVTKEVKAEAQKFNLTAEDYGGVALAHELAHPVIAPEDVSIWNMSNEHMIDKPELGNDYLSHIMNDVYLERLDTTQQPPVAVPFVNHFRMSEATTKFGSFVQQEVDLLENAGLNELAL